MKKVKLPDPPPFSLFIANFIGEYVRIYTKLNIEETQSDGEQYFTNKSPVIVHGTLLDYDNDYYYLGTEPNSINQAVKITETTVVQVAEDETEEMAILNDMPKPDPKELN